MRIINALCVGSVLGGNPAVAHASSVEEFYRGKTINLIIGAGVGGGTDISGRLIARYLGSLIPGGPAIVARNMPGASSLRAAEYTYNVAPRDGTTLAFVQPYVVVEKVTNPAVKIDTKRLTWIGRLSTQTTFGLAWHTAPVQTVDQAKKTELFVTANSVTGTAAMVPWALNRMIGTRFKVVVGYESGNVAALALERDEAGGIGSASSEFLESKPAWTRDRLIRFLYTIGYERSARAPDAPTIVELAENDNDRKAMRLLASSSAVGRILMGPPDVPRDRAEALRRAFEKLVRLPEFVAEATRQKIEIEPLPGEELRTVVDDLFALPPNVIDRMNALTAQQK